VAKQHESSVLYNSREGRLLMVPLTHYWPIQLKDEQT